MNNPFPLQFDGDNTQTDFKSTIINSSTRYTEIPLKKWLLFPVIVLSLLSCLFVYFAYALQDKNVLWHIQVNTFLSLNGNLNYLSSEFWHNITLLGDALILFPFFIPLYFYRPLILGSLFCQTNILSEA